MPKRLAAVTILVREYDEAIAFFTGPLGFALVEDSPRGPGKRWVVCSPEGGTANVLLARAVTDEQRAHVGQQAGGRVAFFLHTDNIDSDVARMRAAGVEFVESPRAEPYGKVVVFRDLYGNRWDLIEPT